MRFESRRDRWLVLLLRVIPVVVLAMVGGAWFVSHHDLRGPIAGAVIVIVVELVFFESILRSTYYVVQGQTLTIRSSFITWRVPVREIRSITPTRSAVSSPALSLDRLRIEYGERWIMVSPDRRVEFIEALRAINPSIVA